MSFLIALERLKNRDIRPIETKLAEWFLPTKTEPQNSDFSPMPKG